jgi:hypothetical protein
MTGNAGGETGIGIIMKGLGTRKKGVNYRLQRGEGPSLENIPDFNDNPLPGLADDSTRLSKTMGEILESVSFSSAISKLVFIDNIFKQSKNTIQQR